MDNYGLLFIIQCFKLYKDFTRISMDIGLILFAIGAYEGFERQTEGY